MLVMALVPLQLPHHHLSSSLCCFFHGGGGLRHISISAPLSLSSLQLKKNETRRRRRPFQFQLSYRRRYSDEEGEEELGEERFDEAVVLFNEREYYKCHDFLEALWNTAEEPNRTLFHGILQCAVGFHHLLNKNHKGAMMELGEGLCKLRKMNFESGPFYCFEQEISAALDFIYHTQIELAACSEDICMTMDRSERSYQLLGGYAAGQDVYRLQVVGPDRTTYIVFSPGRAEGRGEEPPIMVKLPLLNATQQDLPLI